VKLSIRGIKAYFTGGSWRSEVRRHLLPTLWIGIAVSAFFAALTYLNAVPAQLENRTLDWRFTLRPEREAAPDDVVVILAFDQQTLDRLKMRWPVPRSVYAPVLDRLSEAGARVVALDFTFSEASPAEQARQDKIMGEAILRSRSWIVLGSDFDIRSTEYGQVVSYLSPTLNIDPNRTHVGFVNVWPDLDGVVRYAYLVKRHQKKLHPSFDLKVLERYLGLKPEFAAIRGDWLNYGGLKVPAQGGVKMLINYRGGAGKFKTISLENVLDPEVFPGLRTAGVFKDKIVLVGPAFATAHDQYAQPYGQGEMLGVEIHANVLDTILNRNYLWRLPRESGVLLVFLWVMVTAFICIRLRPMFSPLVMLVFISAHWVLAFMSFVYGNLILPVILPSLAVAAATLSAMVYRVLTEERRSHQIKGMFSRYVSPKVVDELVKNPSAALALGGKKMTVTVLFSDIRSFTSMSEQLTPEAVVELLNEYFQAMTDVIFSYDGMVDKYIGDAIMAIFGAPVAHADDPVRAVRAGLEMLQILRAMNHHWESQGRRTFEIGVGINTGEAIVGNMGSTHAMGYTVIGDTVNLASRLEGLNKQLGTSLLISENTYQRVKDHFEVQAFSDIKVKGKAEAMTVYAVKAAKD
jgi:adenylate cyclase